MSMFRNYFGFGAKAAATTEPVESKKEAKSTPVRALPGIWYTSPEMYELERRSIFSRKWLLMTHGLRLKKPDLWLRYSLAGFDMILLSNSFGGVTGFHNLCRECAYPFVRSDKQSGSTVDFACSCYKTSSSHIPVHVHIDNNGFIWVNFDSKEKTEVEWDEDLEGIDTQPRHADFNFDDYDYDHTWGLDANYNWKIAADNYNECYHCKTTHPDLTSVANLEAYKVDTDAGYILHDVATTPEQQAAGMTVTPTYFFPNSSMNVMSHFLFIQKFMPTGPTTTSVQYEVYRNRYSSEENFQMVSEMYKRVMNEDKALCNLAQQNLNAGVFINGELHPRMEKGPLFFQGKVRETVIEHFKREKNLGREIWPARFEIPTSALLEQEQTETFYDLPQVPSQNVVVF